MQTDFLPAWQVLAFAAALVLSVLALAFLATYVHELLSDRAELNADRARRLAPLTRDERAQLADDSFALSVTHSWRGAVSSVSVPVRQNGRSARPIDILELAGERIRGSRTSGSR